ncbi:MAG: ATP-binding protein [Actinomycetota bacterium]|nr:ATP-binding protein [Actinomycetota bacterium]
MREPMVKDLQGARKTTKLGPFAVETHQATILAALLVFYATFCYYLAGFFGLSTTRAAIWLTPIIPVALLFAFYRSRDGYHLDFVIWRKVISFLRPDVFFKRPRDNVKGGWRSMRDAIQRLIPAEEFHYEMLRCDDGTYVVAFRVVPKNLSMIGDTERMRVFRAATELYNSLDFPWMEITRSREGSTGRYTRRFRSTTSATISPEERKLKKFAAEHAEYLDEELPGLSIFERRGYAVLHYNPVAEKAKEAGASTFGPVDALLKILGFGGKGGKTPGGKASKKDAKRRQEEAEAAYRVLSTRANSFYNGFVRLGCRISALTDMEFLSFVLGQMTDWDEDSERPPTLYEHVSLDPGGYDAIPDEKRDELIREAEKIREEAPPALGIGDLVADKIAPDTAKIFPDYLEVDGKFHTTMFVSGWPDEVFFGMLADLNAIEGRVKVVKFVDPRPKREAQQILGGRVAALRASGKTADDGNVNAEQQRDIAEYTNTQALYEINSGRQRYLEMSVLVHIEADSEDRLYGMAQEVQDTLQGWNVSSQLAREQTWEGLLSTNPFGRNYLSERYCPFGMLSRPAACLFSYGSQQIDHENGAFIGVDARSNSVMTLDTRQLVNPHGVILGQSGGGKSFVIKSISTRYLMFGHRQVILDPEGNSRYVRVAKKVGGAFAVIAPGSKHKINPFDLHEDYMNLDLLEDIFGDEDEEEEHDAEEAYEAARSAALEGKALEITRMVSLMLVTDDSNTGAVGGLSSPEASVVERAVLQAYEDAGIKSDDPDTHTLPAPIFPDFWNILKAQAETNTIVSDLLEKLWSWHSGALSKIFDAPTNVDLSNKYLVFQISKVEDRQKAPVMHAILEFLNGILSNRNEPSDCWIDEAWSLLAFPMSAKFIETMCRSGRARDNAMWLASQAVNEFVESRQGNVILDLAATHMIFRHEHQKSARATASIHDLSDEEIEELLNFQPGEGYLVVDQARVPMQVLASEKEKELYNTDPRIEAANKEKRRNRAETQRRIAEAQYETAAEESRREKAALPGMPGGDEEMRVYAFTGGGATEAATAVAKLLGRAARKERLHVLAVDATGGSFAEALSAAYGAAGAGAPPPPDAFLTRGEPDLERMGLHIANTGHTALKVVTSPRNRSLPAAPLQEAASEVFDLCVVACGDTQSSYAEDWLLAADEVVACSASDPEDALAAARDAEERRDANGTLLAVTRSGSSAGAPYPEGANGASRPLYSLGPGAVRSGSQADKGLRALARVLVYPNDRTDHEAVPIGGGPANSPDTEKEETSG